MKRLFSPMVAMWHYFVAMNSEKDGTPSIKRNITWGVATALVIIEIGTLYALYHLILRNPGQADLVSVFKFLSWVYVSIDATLILLALGITSIEKITTLAKAIKGDEPSKEQNVQGSDTTAAE